MFTSSAMSVDLIGTAPCDCGALVCESDSVVVETDVVVIILYLFLYCVCTTGFKSGNEGSLISQAFSTD